MKYIIREWNSKALPNPFEEKHQGTIAKLYRLFSSISMFVEDYISKATSSNPPQAYLCLPQIANPNRGLYYKEHSFSPRHVTLDELTSSERHFILWAFLKYEMCCKVQGSKAAPLMEDNEYSAIAKKAIHELTTCEHEAIHCVIEQRAWAFLDDTRFFKMGLNHFPTIEELDNQRSTAFGTEAIREEKERQRLRLLQLCQYRKEAGIEDTKSEEREYVFSAEDSIPRFFDPPGTRGVTTFWEYL
ncbi:hypothetical protein CEK26_002248 [Fusarium fujikuroi]|nr:hypothetical protein CEK27_002245 [Fusarium fujikuroi]QGJ00804.1 hypothetical protein CEK26_002248 [Fusarium fujikuroi]